MTTHLITRATSLVVAAAIREHSQLSRNPLYDRIGVLQHLVVPEPQDTIPEPLQKLRPLSVNFTLLGVLAAVDLDDELVRQRAEIHDVGADGLLAPEPHAGDLSCTQSPPQAVFCIGWIAPQ